MSGKHQIFGTQHDIDENCIAYPLSIEELRMELGIEPLSVATKRIQERYNTNLSNREK